MARHAFNDWILSFLASAFLVTAAGCSSSSSGGGAEPGSPKALAAPGFSVELNAADVNSVTLKITSSVAGNAGYEAFATELDQNGDPLVGSEPVKVAVSENATECLFPGLKSNTRYSFALLTVSRVGTETARGAKSAPQEKTTNTKVLPAPATIEGIADRRTSKTIAISFPRADSDPKSDAGSLDKRSFKKYKLQFRRGDSSAAALWVDITCANWPDGVESGSDAASALCVVYDENAGTDSATISADATFRVVTVNADDVATPDARATTASPTGDENLAFDPATEFAPLTQEEIDRAKLPEGWTINEVYSSVTTLAFELPELDASALGDDAWRIVGPLKAVFLQTGEGDPLEYACSTRPRYPGLCMVRAGLSPGVTYTASVKATSISGAAGRYLPLTSADGVTFTTLAADDPNARLAAPSMVVAAGVSRDAIVVTWDENPAAQDSYLFDKYALKYKEKDATGDLVELDCSSGAGDGVYCSVESADEGKIARRISGLAPASAYEIDTLTRTIDGAEYDSGLTIYAEGTTEKREPIVGLAEADKTKRAALARFDIPIIALDEYAVVTIGIRKEDGSSNPPKRTLNIKRARDLEGASAGAPIEVYEFEGAPDASIVQATETEPAHVLARFIGLPDAGAEYTITASWALSATPGATAESEPSSIKVMTLSDEDNSKLIAPPARLKASSPAEHTLRLSWPKPDKTLWYFDKFNIEYKIADALEWKKAEITALDAMGSSGDFELSIEVEVPANDTDSADYVARVAIVNVDGESGVARESDSIRVQGRQRASLSAPMGIQLNYDYLTLGVFWNAPGDENVRSYRAEIGTMDESGFKPTGLSCQPDIDLSQEAPLAECFIGPDDLNNNRWNGLGVGSYKVRVVSVPKDPLSYRETPSHEAPDFVISEAEPLPTPSPSDIVLNRGRNDFSLSAPLGAATRAIFEYAKNFDPTGPVGAWSALPENVTEFCGKRDTLGSSRWSCSGRYSDLGAPSDPSEEDEKVTYWFRAKLRDDDGLFPERPDSEFSDRASFPVPAAPPTRLFRLEWEDGATRVGLRYERPLVDVTYRYTPRYGVAADGLENSLPLGAFGGKLIDLEVYTPYRMWYRYIDQFGQRGGWTAGSPLRTADALLSAPELTIIPAEDVTPGSTVTLNWAKPTPTDSLKSYALRVGADPDSLSDVEGCSDDLGADPSCEWTVPTGIGLSTGEKYYFELTALNRDDKGTRSDPSYVTIALPVIEEAPIIVVPAIGVSLIAGQLLVPVGWISATPIEAVSKHYVKVNNVRATECDQTNPLITTCLVNITDTTVDLEIVVVAVALDGTETLSEPRIAQAAE